MLTRICYSYKAAAREGDRLRKIGMTVTMQYVGDRKGNAQKYIVRGYFLASDAAGR